MADTSPVLAWCLAPVTGVLLYRLTMVMHDCGHLTLFSSASTNKRTGKLLGFVTGIDFASFRERHWEHHKRYGGAGDPQGFQYRGLSTMGRRALAWHVVKPLLGLNLAHVVPESLLAPRNLQRILANGEILGFVTVQAIIFVLVTGLGRHPTLVALPIVSAATFGLFFSQLRGIAEHGVRSDVLAQEGFVRSHRSDWLGRLLLYDVHFNYHEEHHRHPGVPSCHLPAFARAAGAQAAARPSMWHSLGRMVRSP